MTTRIQVHSKSANHYNITNSTPEMIAEAAKLVGGNWAKVNGSSIVVHKTYVGKFQDMLKKSEVKSAILTEADLINSDTVDAWIDTHINSGKVSNWLMSGAPIRLLRPYIGKTANEIESAFVEMVSQ